MSRFLLQPEHCIALASFDGNSNAIAFNAAFGVLYGTGMLRSELLALRACDILVGERTRLHVRGSRERTLPLVGGAADRLSLMLRTFGERVSTEAIFASPPVSIGRQNLSRELALRSHLLGFPRPLTWLDLRIAFIRHLTQSQTPFEIVAAMIGYKSVNSVQSMLMLAES
jgi:site-specific recombinase XerD